MTFTFPLFDMIYTETGTISNLTNIEKEQLCEKIKKMDDEGYELLYALIKSYALKYSDDFLSPPFNAKKCKGGYKFDIQNIPDRLVVILSYFVSKHEEKLKEDKLRKSIC